MLLRESCHEAFPFYLSSLKALINSFRCPIVLDTQFSLLPLESQIDIVAVHLGIVSTNLIGFVESHYKDKSFWRLEAAQGMQASGKLAAHVLKLSGPLLKRGLHIRNKEAKKYIGKGWSYLQEVDRVIGYTEPDDELLTPQLKKAKENFELALEVDNLNTQARFWLAKLHLYYHMPGACQAIGLSLLKEAADMGNADAQYELACVLRQEGGPRGALTKSFNYLQQVVTQLHPEALFLLGTSYLAGDNITKDLNAAAWCLHKASQKGHVGASIAYGALVLKGTKAPEKSPFLPDQGIPANEISVKAGRELTQIGGDEKFKHAKNQFSVAALEGNDLAFIWLNRLEEIKAHERLDTTV